MKPAQYHTHPADIGMSTRIWGHQLETGDILEATDVYNATSGHWGECPCPGLPIVEGPHVIWIRKVTPD